MSALSSIRRTILRRMWRQHRVIGHRVVSFGFEKAQIPVTRRLRGWAIRRVVATNWRMRFRWILDAEPKPSTNHRRRIAAKRGGGQ